MGNFYTNTLLRGVQQGAVVAELSRLRRAALISPQLGDYVLICDKVCATQSRQIEKLSSNLSATLQCPVFSILNHDDDILMFWLCKSGKLIDQYDSTPGYETGKSAGPKGGNATLLAQELWPTADTALVESILRAGTDRFLFAIERHEQLAAALDLPSESVGSGYDYLDGGEEFGSLSASSMIRTP